MSVGEILSIAMFGTLVLCLFSGFPVAFVIGGIGVIFGLLGWSLDYFSLIEFFNLVPRIWGQTAENLILVAIPCFIFMGIMLEKSRVAADLLDVLAILLRRVPGGLALAVTLLGGIMAASTGIIGASVVMMTLMAMPTMLRHGYDKGLACGTIASSATLGILIPPSIMLVMMGDLLSISVGRLFLTAILPGLLLLSLYSIFVIGLAWFRPHLAPSVVEEEEIPRRDLYIRCLRALMAPVALIVAVLGSIFGGLATPTEAAGVGAFGAILLAAFNRRLTWGVTREVCENSALTIGMIFMIMIGATVFSYVFRSLGGEAMIVDALTDMGIGAWGTLLVLMGVVFLLGFFFDWIEITLIVLPIFGPVVAGLDFGDHVRSTEVIYWFAAMMAVNLQTSFLTPPFGMALFFVHGAAKGSIHMQHLYRGIVPFVGLQLAGLAAVMIWPEIALWLQRP
ncbi:TRAP transporter large permease subunit [Paracoccus versutus]|uniref:TRAP transporter large permease n=1 Tax=Paracoccus versutus TaxID=34007 RepID=UPI001FB7DBA9|nr:TRAP transporter large permease subunit [Paracoccus versutus]MCJ1901404.1 TRAP transporter large permease subunit [Paracoccus versutus]